MLRSAIEDVVFLSDPDSNVLNTDDLASLTITLDDLGESGGGGPQRSQPLFIGVLVEAVNDRPVVEMPDVLTAEEDVPVHVPGVSVSDTDANEAGGGLQEHPPSSSVWPRLGCT